MTYSMERYTFMGVKCTHTGYALFNQNWCIFHNFGYETLFRTILLHDQKHWVKILLQDEITDLFIPLLYDLYSTTCTESPKV